MSSSSDVGSTGGGELRHPAYRAAPQLIWRATRDGVVVRRWDRDDETVALNTSAWLVLESLVSAPDAMGIDDIVQVVSTRAAVGHLTVGDLGQVLDELARRHLVIGAG